MKYLHQLRKRAVKGVSPVVATLLLVAIAVAAGVLTFNFVNSLVTTQATQAQTSIRIQLVEFFFKDVDGTTGFSAGDHFYILVRVLNSGSVPATIVAIIVEGENFTGTETRWLVEGYSRTISPSEVAVFGMGNATATDANSDLATVTDVTFTEGDNYVQVTKPDFSINTSSIYTIRVITATGFSAEVIDFTTSTIPEL